MQLSFSFADRTFGARCIGLGFAERNFEILAVGEARECTER
jgi:hypothetical protein